MKGLNFLARSRCGHTIYAFSKVRELDVPPTHPALGVKDGAGTGSAGPNPTLSPATRGLGGPITPPMCCGDQRDSLVTGRQRAQPRPRLRPPSRLCPRSAGGVGFRGPGQPQAATCPRDLGRPASSPRSSAGSRDRATLARGGARGRDLHRDGARPASDTARRAPGRRPAPREARAPPRSGPQAFRRPCGLRTGARGPGVRPAPARGVLLFPRGPPRPARAAHSPPWPAPGAGPAAAATPHGPPTCLLAAAPSHQTPRRLAPAQLAATRAAAGCARHCACAERTGGRRSRETQACAPRQRVSAGNASCAAAVERGR